MLSVPVFVAIGSIVVSSSAVMLYRRSRRVRAVSQEKMCPKEDLQLDSVQLTELAFREGDTVLVSRGKFKGFFGSVNQVELSGNAEEHVTVCLETANGPLPEVINAKNLQNITTQTEKDILTESNARPTEKKNFSAKLMSNNTSHHSWINNEESQIKHTHRIMADADVIEQGLYEDTDSNLDLNFLIDGQYATGVVTKICHTGVIKIKTRTPIEPLEWLVINQSVLAVSYEVDQDCLTAFVIDHKNLSALSVSDPVIVTGKACDIPVGEGLQGRVLDCLGCPQDGKGPLEFTHRSQIKSDPPGIFDREPVNQPLQTGVLAIDSMIPIGRGQRELILGDAGTGKTTLAIDAIIAQKNNEPDKKVHCIYVSIGKKQSEVAHLVSVLESHDAMEYTTVLAATIGQSAIQRYLVPFAGCAMAEYYRDKGLDALIIYDDLTQHADASRECALRTTTRVGMERYPKLVFDDFINLLERAACSSSQSSGGAVTAIAIGETLNKDIATIIPSSLIHAADGQIVLDKDLFLAGVRPAINYGLSVSRVGGAAQTKMMKKLAGTFKLEFTQFHELKAFAEFGYDLDEANYRQLNHGRRVVELLKQDKHSPLTIQEMLIKLLLFREKKLDSIEVVKIRQYIDRLFYNIKTDNPSFMNQTLEDLEKNMSQLDGILPEAQAYE